MSAQIGWSLISAAVACINSRNRVEIVPQLRQITNRDKTVKAFFQNKLVRGFALLLLVVLILIGRPAFHLAKSIWNDVDDAAPLSPGVADDASRLNAIGVAEVFKIPADPETAEHQLSGLLRRASANQLKVSVAGARHTMGGHTISRGGIVIDMLPFNRMELNETNRILKVQAGARWSAVIRFLNQHGLSPEIMQSNSDFSVGGSISVNCHGWQFNRPPIASSVESFRLMLADGRIVNCSRSENRELFSLVLGGYGLFGIILDVHLRVVANETYKVERIGVATGDYINVLQAKTADLTDVAMIYGRLRVTREDFLAEGVLNILQRQSDPARVVSTFAEPKNATLKRSVFRGSAGSDYGKRLRWTAEKNWDAYLNGDFFERNVLLYQPVSLFQNRRNDSTDILMECFVPPPQMSSFVTALGNIVSKTGADLLNVTVRHVNRDEDTFLRYASEDMVALVMLFNQRRDEEGEEKMAMTARQIIDAALEHGGSFYLPYRLHATPEQLVRAYPQVEEFFAHKRKYDPDALFQNEFYRKYSKQDQALPSID